MKTFIKAVIAAMLLVGGIMVVISAANAQQPQCAPYQVVTEFLDKKHKETPQFGGTSQTGSHLLIIFASKEKGTFTVVSVHAARKIACIRTSGINWNKLVAKEDSEFVPVEPEAAPKEPEGKSY